MYYHQCQQNTSQRGTQQIITCAYICAYGLPQNSRHYSIEVIIQTLSTGKTHLFVLMRNNVFTRFFLIKIVFFTTIHKQVFLPVWVSLVDTDVLRDVVFNVKENVKFLIFFFKTFIGSKCKHSGKEVANPVSVYTRSFYNSFLWR